MPKDYTEDEDNLRDKLLVELLVELENLSITGLKGEDQNNFEIYLLSAIKILTYFVISSLIKTLTKYRTMCLSHNCTVKVTTAADF